MCSQNDHPPYEETVPTCDAFLTEPRVSPGGWGLTPVPCSATKGLVIVEDAAGVYRRACPAVGHLRSVIRRFGVKVDEPAEPDWTLGPTAAELREEMRADRELMRDEMHGRDLDGSIRW